MAVEGLVEVTADPYGAAPVIQGRLDQVGHLGLPGSGLAADDNDDRLFLLCGVARRRRKDQAVQHVLALLLAQHHRGDTLHQLTFSIRMLTLDVIF